MHETTTDASLSELGDALDRATRRDLRRGHGRSLRRVGLAVTMIAVIGTGTVAAATLLSPEQVAAGMPGGAVIFDQTDPTCTADSAGTVFHCTLGAAPGPDGISDFTGTKEVLVVEGKVAGGCIGQDAAGMQWDCYLGQDAVDQEIITKDYLGEPAVPARG